MLADDELRDLLVSGLPELRPDVEAELERVLTRAHSRSRRRRASYVGGLAAAVAATVIVLGHDWETRADAPDVVDKTVDKTVVQAQPLVNRGVYADPAALEPGRYMARFAGLGEYPGPRIELDIPAGWGQDDVYAFATAPAKKRDVRRIDLFADMERITPPECRHDEAGGVRVGNSPQVFAHTLAGFGSASATAQPVTLGGYDGYRVTLPGPTGVKPGRCASTLLLGDNMSQLCAFDLPGWSSTTWVFNVDDHLVVVAASQGPNVTSAEAQELVGIVESLTFVLP